MPPKHAGTCWKARNSRLHGERFTGKRIVAVFATVRKDAESQRFSGPNSIFSCHAVAHATGEAGNFRNPPAIALLLDFDL